MTTFEDILQQSDAVRPGYSASLGSPSLHRVGMVLDSYVDDLPPSIRSIYSRVSGTRRGDQNGVLLDFLPGLRLVHVSEMGEEYERVRELYDPGNGYVPFLVGFAGDCICAVGERIVAFDVQDPGEAAVAETVAGFFGAIGEMYDRGVYGVVDGILSCLDEDLEVEIASRHNPEADYW